MQKQLRDGLILRTLSEDCASDREQLPDFVERVFGENADGTPSPFAHTLNIWQKSMMEGHPTITGDDIFVVVDPAKDDLVVSATTLIPQTWLYEDIPIGVGRPEIVATHPDYRRRGLVRETFTALHEHSHASGQVLQVISGIEYFYRQFGYSMAIDFSASLVVPLASAFDLPADKTPTYTLRPATEADLPDIARWTEGYSRHTLLSVSRTLEQWRYEAFGMPENHTFQKRYFIIIDADNQGVGYVAIRSLVFPGVMTVSSYIVGEETSYLDTFADVMRGIKGLIPYTYGASGTEVAPPHLAVFHSGMHPTLDTLLRRQLGGAYQTYRYTWYVRIGDYPAFMRQIAPVLERRLRGSGAHNWTGTLNIGFYERERLALQFERGVLIDARMEADTGENDCDFPYHTFTHVVLGYHSPAEVHDILTDVSFRARAEALLEILFPKRPSWIVSQV